MKYCHATGALYGAPQSVPACPAPDRILARGLFSTAGAVALVSLGSEPPSYALWEDRFVAQKMTGHRVAWTSEDVRELRAHSQARTPLTVIAKKMKRTEGALRRKATILGIGLGHRRYHR